MAAFAGLLGAQVLHLADEDTFLLAAAVTAIVACGWWFLDKVTLQHIAMFAALTLTVVAIVLATIPDVHSWWIGMTLWACSAAWALLALRGLVPPRRTGLVVAVMGLLAATPVMPSSPWAPCSPWVPSPPSWPPASWSARRGCSPRAPWTPS